MKNIHHIIPRSRQEEGFDVHKKRNKIEIDEKVHKNLHRLFVNKTPQEQLRFLYEINKSALEYSVKNQIEYILSQNPEDFYLETLLK